MENNNEKFSAKAKQNIFFGICLNLCTSIQYCWSILGSQMISQYGWTTVQASRPYSFLTLSSSMISIVTGRWGEARSHREPILFGALCLGIGLISSSMHQNPWLMILTAGILLGFSSGPVSGNVTAQANKWSPKSKCGLATALVTVSYAVGALYMTPLITWLNNAVGLIGTFRVMGICAMGLMFVFAFLQPQPPKAKGVSKEDELPPGAEIDDGSYYKNTITPNQMLKTSHYARFAIMYFCGAAAGQTFTSQVTIIAKTQVHGIVGAAAFFVVMMALGNAASRLFWSVLSDKLGTFRCTQIMLGIQVVNMLLFRFYTTPLTFTFGCLVLAFCFGGIVPQLWNWISTVFGTRYVGSMQGQTTCWWGVGGMISPMIAAYLMDTTGTYTMSYLVIAAITAVGFAVSLSYNGIHKAIMANKKNAAKITAENK